MPLTYIFIFSTRPRLQKEIVKNTKIFWFPEGKQRFTLYLYSALAERTCDIWSSIFCTYKYYILMLTCMLNSKKSKLLKSFSWDSWSTVLAVLRAKFEIVHIKSTKINIHLKLRNFMAAEYNGCVVSVAKMWCSALKWPALTVTVLLLLCDRLGCSEQM